MKTKIRGLDLKLHLLSLKYSVLNVTTCTYQIQLQLLCYNWYRYMYMLGWPKDRKLEVSMVPENIQCMLNETYLASSMFPPASFKTFSPVATSRSTEKKKLFLNIHMYACIQIKKCIYKKTNQMLFFSAVNQHFECILIHVHIFPQNLNKLQLSFRIQ